MKELLEAVKGVVASQPSHSQLPPSWVVQLVEEVGIHCLTSCNVGFVMGGIPLKRLGPGDLAKFLHGGSTQGYNPHLD